MTSGVTIYGIAANMDAEDVTLTLQVLAHDDGMVSLWVDRPDSTGPCVCLLELTRPQAAALRLLLQVTGEAPAWSQE